MRVLGSALGAGIVVAGLAMSGAAQAQTIMQGIAVASDFDAPYDDVGPPPLRRYAPRAYLPPPAVYGGYEPPAYAPPVMPPGEVYRILRQSGYSPLGAPRQRGLVYTIAVINLDGDDGRLVIDARNGRILRFVPAYRYGSRMPGDEVAVAFGPPASFLPLSMPRPQLPTTRATVPLPKPMPRAASAQPPLPEKSAAIGVSQPKTTIPPAPTAALVAASAAPAVAPPVAKPPVTLQPTQSMPAAQGVE